MLWDFCNFEGLKLLKIDAKNTIIPDLECLLCFIYSEAEKALLRRHSDGDHVINLEDEMDQLLAEDQVKVSETDLTRNDDDLLSEMENCNN